ncbi:MAG: carboxypeptidase-like regulatory domain-containing protein [Gemmatimonadota bacterium]|jgi:hypothetical protein
MSHAGRALGLLLSGLATAGLPQATPAQTLAGKVVAAADGAPLVGTRVTLEDVAGTLLTTTLTDGRGGFSVPLPNDGAFVVQADRAGFRASTATVAADSVAPPVELRLARIVIPLDDLSTDMGKGCRVPARTAERVAELWNETRKALAVAALVEDQGRLGYQVETWYRHLDPRRLRVLEEDRTPHVGFRNTLRHPSPPADELAREGYVRGGRPGESLAFYPPDVHTLVSTIFPATHCLGFDGDAPEDGWVGLRFEPLDEQAMDVEGTLWIDARSYEPRRLEFRYTDLPWPLRTDKVGGGAEFRRLSDGAIITSRWWLRMPRVGVRQARITQWAAPTKRYTLAGIVEEGGRVLRVRTPDGSIEEIR